MQEWGESVWIALSIIILTIVIFFSVTLMEQKRAIMQTMNDQQATTDKIKEFRLYSAYDDRRVYCQDMVSVILETRGMPYIQVEMDAGTLYWQSSEAIADGQGIAVQQASNYSSTAILEKLDINKMYNTSLIRGGNGEVIGIKAVAVDP